MAAFEYEPLLADGETIRVLKIDPPSDNTEHISCSLENVSLRAVDTKYIALSHVWGTDYHTLKILLNGQPHHVTPQIWHFLVLAAQRIPNQCLWIDAVCIDQSRETEKEKQIPMMGQIYSRAAMVIAWLWGPLDHFDGVSRLTAARREAAATIADVSCDILQGINRNTEVSLALMRLIFHNYWSRVWIVQEIRLARDREFWWEGQCISTHRLEVIATTIAAYTGSKLSSRIPQDSGTLNELIWKSLSQGVKVRLDRPTLLDHTSTSTSHGSRKLGNRDDKFDLAETVVKHKDFKCGIQADHVFGFLGIVTDGPSFYVEYGMLLTDFLVQIWKLSSSMNVQTLAAVENVLGADQSKLMHRVHVPWYTELDMVLRALQEIAPSLRQAILDLKLCKPSSPAVSGIMSTASRLLKVYRTDATRGTQTPYTELLAEIVHLVKRQQHEHTVKIPTSGLYYVLEGVSMDKPGPAKIRKVLKVTQEPVSNKPGEEGLVVKIATIGHKPDPQHIPSIYVNGNALLFLVNSSIPGLLSLAGSRMPGSTASVGQPRNLKTLSANLGAKDLLKLLRMSENTHPVWQGAKQWTLPKSTGGTTVA